MGKLTVHIEHGSDGISLKTAVIGGGAVLLMASGGAAGVTSGLMDLLWWLGGVMAVSVGVASVLIVRKIRATRHHGYVESIHGPSERNIAIDLDREKRNELARIRYIRHEIERERIIRASFGSDYTMQMPAVDFDRPYSPPLAPGDGDQGA